MKINGSLVFDGSSASVVENLRLERLTALPAILPADVGRLVYNSATNTIHVGTNVGNVLSWVPLATGGDASALLAEVDRIETSLGLNADGSFNAGSFTGNLAGQTSYAGLIATLQGLVNTNTTAIGAEVTRATGAEAALGTRIDDAADAAADESTRLEGLVTAERDRAIGIEGPLRTELDAEVLRATGAEGGLGTRIDGVIATAGTTTTRLEGLITAEADRAGDAEDALGGRIDGLTTTVSDNATAAADALAAEVDRAEAAELALDGRITTEVGARTTAVQGVADNLAAEVTRATGAETALGTRITGETNARTTAIADLRTEVTGAIAGLTWEAPVDLIAADATTTDLTGLANGYRIVDLATNAIFTVTGGALGAPEAMADGAAFFNRTNDTGYVFNGTTVVPFNGAASITAGNGLVTTGNRVDVVSASGTLAITEDSVDISEAVLTSISDNADAVAAEADRATTAEEGLGDRIDDEVQARIDAIAGEVAARDAAILVETNRATGVEGGLNTRLTTAEGLITTNAGTAAAAVTAERDRALAAEGALGTRIDDEATARGTAITAAEGRVAALAATERTRVDTAFADAVTARDAAILVETNRATAAENAIRTRVNGMYYLYEGAGGAAAPSAATHTVAHNLGQRYCNVTVVDETDNVVIPESIVFDSATALTVTFNEAIACRVIVMGLAPAA